MNIRTKRAISNKTRSMCGLTDILKDYTDDIRVYANAHEYDKLDGIIYDTKEILQKLTEIVSELEYTLYTKR